MTNTKPILTTKIGFLHEVCYRFSIVSMSPLFNCDVEFLPSPHLMQIYTGFFKLRDLGIIDLKLKPKLNGNPSKGTVKAKINNKDVIYDALDGYNWIQDSIEKNLEYFHTYSQVDYYFKRSYHKELLGHKAERCELFPLGLNYNVQPESDFLHLSQSLYNRIKHFIKQSKLLKKIFNKGFLYTKDFEYYPIRQKNNKILFVTRLWNPEDVTLEHTKKERVEANRMRVECIKACKSKYGQNFTGGLILNEFTTKQYNELAIPQSLTKKQNYVQLVKEHNICVTTTGLHNSIGWKFGEYVAASRAIVSEPLMYDLPGNFEIRKNYLEFTNPDDLLNNIDTLISNRELVQQMMQNNFQYYQAYVKPEILVLNTLITVSGNS